MSPALLSSSDSLLLLVDIQERFRPAVSGFEGVVLKSSILLKAALRLGIPVLASEQYPKALGSTVEELRALLQDTGAYFPKMCFSAVGCEPLMAKLRAAGRRQVLLCGVEAHVCVLQTALELQAAGFSVFAAADAVASRRESDRDAALSRMVRAGVESVTTEMAVFEWLKAAGTAEFKELQALIK